MSNNINVKLKDVDGISVVDIDDNGGGNNEGNKVGQSAAAQTISWNLTGNLAQADFQAMTDSPPGFKWITTPPAGIFSEPQITNNGRQLEIDDTNCSAATSGSWIYQIAINLNGTIYVSQASTLPQGSIKDPVIINREP